MASVFKNATQAVGTSYATAYTCPALTTAIVIFAQVANVTGTTSTDLSLQWLDSSQSNLATELAHTISIPANASLGTLDGKLVLEAGDALQAKASANTSLVLSLSVLEMS